MKLPPKPAACRNCGPCRREETCLRIERWETAAEDAAEKAHDDREDYDRLIGEDLWMERSP